MGLLRLVLLLALPVVCLSAAKTAWAASIHWDGPEDCPKDEFVFTLQQTLERSIDDVGDVDVWLDLEGAGNTWRAEFSLGPDTDAATAAKRTLEGTSCTDVSRAVAVAVAVALHASGQIQDAPTDDHSDESAGPEPPKREPRHRVDTEADVAMPPIREPQSAIEWNISVSAGLVVDGALLGQLALGYSLGSAISWHGWELGVAGPAADPARDQ